MWLVVLVLRCAALHVQVNELPLYPNETLLWDENLVPLGQYYGGKVMALPKLNLQFLTSHDYLLRRVVEGVRSFVGRGCSYPAAFRSVKAFFCSSRHHRG